jgi:hypothetical protein
MNWQIAIGRNREALLSIIIVLMRSLGLTQGGMLTTLPFHLYRKALLIIRPAESALRRLIIMAAYELELRGFNLASRAGRPSPVLRTTSPGTGEVKPLEVLRFSSRPLDKKKRKTGAFNLAPSGRGVSEADGEGFFRRQNRTDEGQRHGSFQLIEPLKTFGAEPVDYNDFGATFGDNTAPTTRVPAVGLGRRLLALNHALTNIDKQARRLMRWYAMRDAALKQNQPHRYSPMRPGLPPYAQKRPKREVELVLNECHSLAIYARERRDSS